MITPVCYECGFKTHPEYFWCNGERQEPTGDYRCLDCDIVVTGRTDKEEVEHLIKSARLLIDRLELTIDL